MQIYILTYLHAYMLLIQSQLLLTIQQDHSVSKLYGFRFDGHVRILEELSLLKSRAIKKSNLDSSQKTRKLSPPPPTSDASLTGSHKPDN